MSDSCGHVLNVVYLCKTCVEQDLELQKELNAFYVDKLNKAEAENERLKRLAASESNAKEKAWQYITELKSQLDFKMVTPSGPQS